MKLLTAIGTSIMLASSIISPTANAGVTYEDKVVTWSGSFDPLNYYTFTVLTEDNPIEKIIFHSNGGLVNIGYSLADIIKKNKISVEVNEYCDSACSIAAIASDNLSGEGVLGFHLAYLNAPPGNNDDFYYEIARAGNIEHNRYIIDMLRKNPYMTETLVDEIISDSSPDKLIEVKINQLSQNKYNLK